MFPRHIGIAFQEFIQGITGFQIIPKRLNGDPGVFEHRYAPQDIRANLYQVHTAQFIGYTADAQIKLPWQVSSLSLLYCYTIHFGIAGYCPTGKANGSTQVPMPGRWRVAYTGAVVHLMGEGDRRCSVRAPKNDRPTGANEGNEGF